MSEVKHTPGPWVADDNGFIRQPLNEYTSVHVATVYGARVTGQMLANARLIAAAPDYDEIVRGIADDLGFAEWGTPEHAESILREVIEKWHGKARAAIAKAEGRS